MPPQTLIERTTTRPVMAYCHRIITGPGGLHAYERHELAIPTIERDVAIAAWVIRCLANPHNPDSLQILETIAQHRRELARQDAFQDLLKTMSPERSP